MAGAAGVRGGIVVAVAVLSLLYARQQARLAAGRSSRRRADPALPTKGRPEDRRNRYSLDGNAHAESKRAHVARSKLRRATPPDD